MLLQKVIVIVKIYTGTMTNRVRFSLIPKLKYFVEMQHRRRRHEVIGRDSDGKRCSVNRHHVIQSIRITVV